MGCSPSEDLEYMDTNTGYSCSGDTYDANRRAIAANTPWENLDMLRGLIQQLVPDQEAVEWIGEYLEELAIQMGKQDTIIRYFRGSDTASATIPSFGRSTLSNLSNLSSSVPSHSPFTVATPPAKLRKLTPKHKAKLANEDVCFRCRQKGHYSYDECCPNNQWKRRRATSDTPAAAIPKKQKAVKKASNTNSVADTLVSPDTATTAASPPIAPPIAPNPPPATSASPPYIPPSPLPPSAATSATPSIKSEVNTAIKSEPHTLPATITAPQAKSEPPDSSDIPVYTLDTKLTPSHVWLVPPNGTSTAAAILVAIPPWISAAIDK
ncbi:MAG: hypothetical protein M1820_001962 [Bogoriella megaspora]|nr:MAG: hypothetical protein M1820_001962 [Bogoriella megaspora]